MTLRAMRILRFVGFLVTALGFMMTISSCSKDAIGSIGSEIASEIEADLGPYGPPRWAEPGERPEKRVPPESKSIDPRVTRFRDESPVEYGSPGSPRLARFLFLDPEVPGKTVEQRVAEAFALPSDAARLATEATFGQASAWHDEVMGEDASAMYARAEQAYWEAIELAPRAWVIYEALGELYSASEEHCDRGEVERLVQRWGARRDAMLRLAPTVIGKNECWNFLRTLLRDFPDDLDVLGILAREFDGQVSAAGFGIAIRQHALAVAAAAQAPAGLQMTIHRGLIHALLSTGQRGRGMALWNSLSDDQRAWMLRGPSDFERVFPSGFRGIVGPIDQALALELAAVYVLNGEDAIARTVMPSPPIHPAAVVDRPYHGESTPHACHRLLRAALGEPLDDPFDFLLKLAGAGSDSDTSNDTCHHGDAWIELQRRIARAAGYPRLESAFQNARDLRPFSKHSFDYFEERNDGILKSASNAIRDEYQRVRREFEIEDEPEHEDRIDSEIQRRIDSRADSTFAERVAATSTATEPPSESIVRWMAGAAFLPTDRSHDVVRTDRRGAIVVRIHLNQDVDPMGEVSGGGYWLSFSPDGGERWTKRFYTGLRAHFPYVLSDRSDIPILSGDSVQIAAEAHEIDPSTISFPPIGLGTKRRESSLLLTLPLADLTRDRDGDDLPDRLEEALLLSPDDRDSDDDGLPDGVDPLPRTPLRADRTNARSEALMAAIPHLFGADLHANVVAPFEGANLDEDLERAMGVSARVGSERSLFVVGDPSDFESLHFDRRVIVLSAEESTALRQRLSVFYPFSIGLFVLDHDERRVYMRWGGGWTGGSLGFERSLGRWKVNVLSHWMT